MKRTAISFILPLVILSVLSGIFYQAPQAAAGRRNGFSHMRGKGLCHAAVREIMPGDLQPFFHKIVKRESGDDPGAWNINRNGSIDRGCVQLNSIHRVSADCAFDARCNIRYALKLYKKAGTNPWRATRG